ncbi:MAG: WbqC family protein [Candidatus Neomarinimicrobiota bacterium]|jgi:hypothetical protein
MKVAIHQPNYMPWCGFFAKMNACNIFVLYDNAQMSKNSYINRCHILNQGRKTWLTVPVCFSLGEIINEVEFADERWRYKHIQTLRSVYGRNAFFKEVFRLIEPILLKKTTSLAQLNMELISTISAYLGISSQIKLSSSIKSEKQSDDRLIDICQTLGADTYISGKGGDNYQNHNKFKTANINLEVQTYNPISYDQNNNHFISGLSILDALFRMGQKTKDLLRYV